MRAFVLRLAVFFTGLLVLLAWILSPYRPNPHLFWTGTVLKHQRLDAAPHPRIVFAGGSNLAFGLDSELVERELPGYHAVNLGLDAGLGLDFLLDEAGSRLSAGDVVVLSLEYEEFLGLRKGQASSIARVLEARPANASHLRPISVKTLLDNGFGFFHWLFVSADKKLDEQVIRGPYSLSTFNPYGDATWHLDKEPKTDRLLKAMDREPFRTAPVDVSGRRVLERFHRRCRERGVRVFLSHPPLPDHYRDDERIRRIEEKVYRRVSIPVLDTPGSTMLPIEEFYDTEYHLLRHGREIRTRRLLARLRERLPASGGAGPPAASASRAAAEAAPPGSADR